MGMGSDEESNWAKLDRGHWPTKDYENKFAANEPGGFQMVRAYKFHEIHTH